MPFERLAYRRHLGRVEVVLRERGREAGGEQQLVAIAQRHLELVGEPQDHLRARPRAAGLDEAQVPGGHARLERQVELAEPAPLPPVAQQRADARAGFEIGASL